MARWKNGLESQPVTTYVSEETKQTWKQHADNLDVSLSRFVEMMVNAGRTVYEDTSPENLGSKDPASAKRRIKSLERELELERSESSADAFAVYTELDQSVKSVKEIAEAVDADETLIYEALQLLVDEGLVEYDVMNNGYSRA